ncbi:syringomycin synthetase domain protein [Mycobacterium xenopi 4042]|uniref:Syringomycin synthetase domain protein n=1 Tax=Mycobacterium xenopi 4042 TaxID=1299334 RepID=X8CM25_MYCXE|nr:syringomycin synthetase domain protein [Mycobacterium xenopi 4042]
MSSSGRTAAGRRHACHLAPCTRLLDHFRSVGVLDKQRRPPGERRACRRQGYRLPATVLGPGNVYVLQQDSP